jgi:DUF971 family protein
MQEQNETSQPKYDAQQIAEAFKVDSEKTARPEVRLVSQHTALGEYHVRLQGDELTDQAIQDRLQSADVVIVEFDSTSSGYENATKYKRFMSMAQDSGQDKSLIIMDAVRPAGVETWQNAGIEIEPKDYQALVALDCAQHPVMEMLSAPNKKEIDQNQVVTDIAEKLMKKIPDLDPTLARKLAEGAKTVILLSASFGGGEIFKLIDKYLRVDSFAREVAYQQIVAEQAKHAGGKKIVVVVGMDHLAAVTEALSGQFITRKVKAEVLEEFKRAYNLLAMVTN